MAMLAGLTSLKRSDQILAAIRRMIDKRKNSLNNEAGVRSVTITVKLKNGTDNPRVVLMSVETEDEWAE